MTSIYLSSICNVTLGDTKHKATIKERDENKPSKSFKSKVTSTTTFRAHNVTGSPTAYIVIIHILELGPWQSSIMIKKF